MTVYVTFRAIQSGQITLDTPVVMSKLSLLAAAGEDVFQVGPEDDARQCLEDDAGQIANDLAMAICRDGRRFRAGLRRAHECQKQHASACATRITSTPTACRARVSTRRRETSRSSASRCAGEFPQYAGYFSLEALPNGVKQVPEHQHAHRPLRWRSDGVKTGFICASGLQSDRLGHRTTAVRWFCCSLARTACAHAPMIPPISTKRASRTRFSGRGTLASLLPYGPSRSGRRHHRRHLQR